MNPGFDENLLRRYLLGELNENLQISIEDRVFADEEARVLLETAENDLIDEYVADELSSAEHQRFELMFLNSAVRRQKIEFAKTLAQAAKSHAVAQKDVSHQPKFWQSLFKFSFVPQLAFAAIVVAFVTVGAWFLFVRQTPNPEIVRQTNNQNSSETVSPLPNVAPQTSPSAVSNSNANFDSQTNNAGENNQSAPRNANKFANKNSGAANVQAVPPMKTAASAPTFAALVFPAGITRDNGNAVKLQLTLQPNTQNARLVFNLEKGDEFPIYEIEITRSGAPVVQTKLVRRRQSVILIVPAAKLPNGFYTATLRGIGADGQPETIGYYDFAVRRP